MSTQVNRSRLRPSLIVTIALLIIAGISLYIRIALPYDNVFGHGSVWFQGTDAWYHMRLVDNLLQHFPHRIAFDPYTYYPSGTMVPWPPFFDWLVGGFAWLLDLGSPSQHSIDLAGAYLPPILAAVTIVPVYFIGRQLFNRWVGVVAAGLVAVLPGEFLNRSLLGFADHHVAESLFSAVTILFLILAVKKFKEREISFNHLFPLHSGGRTGERNKVIKPLIYALVAGIFLGIYLLTWVGGLLLIFIISAWLLIQFIIDHVRGKSTDYLCMIGVLVFLVSLIINLPYLSAHQLSSIYTASFLVAILAPVALSGISRVMTRQGVRPFFYPVALAALAGIGLAIFHAANPALLHSMLARFSIFSPAGAALTILEMQPLLLPYGTFSLRIAWVNFTTSFFICFISFGWLIYRSIKEESPDKTLFLVWSLIMLVAVLGQRRFSYYFAVNAALLAGYFAWRVLDFAGLKQLLAEPVDLVKDYVQTRKAKQKRRVEGRVDVRALRQRKILRVRVILTGVALFFLIFFPNFSKAEAIARNPLLITEAWHSSLEWLKSNSPEPFDDPDAYYQLYETPFQYPDTAYSVLSWWDYGHWISRIAHRIPVSNPFQQGVQNVAHFFLAQDEDSAGEMMDKVGSKYIIIDHAMASSKFYAMPQWVGGSQDEFYDTYYQESGDGKLEQITLFYPAYYNSMVVRLYNFDAKAQLPGQILVISYRVVSQEGTDYKIITKVESFSSYGEAEAYMSSQEPGEQRIVSADPFASAVPLEELHSYRIVYESPATATLAGHSSPQIKIFEYVRPAGS